MKNEPSSLWEVWSLFAFTHTHTSQKKKKKLGQIKFIQFVCLMYNSVWSNLVYTSKSFIKKSHGKQNSREIRWWTAYGLKLPYLFAIESWRRLIYSYLWQHFMGFKVPFFLEDKGCMPEIPNSWSLRRNLNRCMLKRRAWDSRVSSGGVSTTVVPHWCLCQEFHEGQESFSICNSVQNVTKPFQMEGKWNIDRKHLG